MNLVPNDRSGAHTFTGFPSGNLFDLPSATRTVSMAARETRG